MWLDSSATCLPVSSSVDNTNKACLDVHPLHLAPACIPKQVKMEPLTILWPTPCNPQALACRVKSNKGEAQLNPPPYCTTGESELPSNPIPYPNPNPYPHYPTLRRLLAESSLKRRSSNPHLEHSVPEEEAASSNASGAPPMHWLGLSGCECVLRVKLRDVLGGRLRGWARQAGRCAACVWAHAPVCVCVRVCVCVCVCLSVFHNLELPTTWLLATQGGHRASADLPLQKNRDLFLEQLSALRRQKDGQGGQYGLVSGRECACCWAWLAGARGVRARGLWMELAVTRGGPRLIALWRSSAGCSAGMDALSISPCNPLIFWAFHSHTHANARTRAYKCTCAHTRTHTRAHTQDTPVSSIYRSTPNTLAAAVCSRNNSFDLSGFEPRQNKPTGLDAHQVCPCCSRSCAARFSIANPFFVLLMLPSIALTSENPWSRPGFAQRLTRGLARRVCTHAGIALFELSKATVQGGQGLA